MAGDDKTEKATPKRRKESRKKGQVAKSTEINSAVVLGASVIALAFFGSKVVHGVAAAMATCFAMMAHPAEVTSGAGLHGLEGLVKQTVLGTVAPIAGLCMVAGVLANVGQIGFRVSFAVLKPDFKKINPGTGFKNVFGPRIFVETAKALAKVAIIGAVVAMILVPQLTTPVAAVGTSPLALGVLLSSNAKAIIERAAIAYLLIAFADLLWQRRTHNKKLKMSKQDVKEEHKSHSLPAELKGAMRRRQLQAARARMMTAVPGADVVVTNPTHFAVALVYDGTRPAPVVVAKGQDLIAAQIRLVAEQHGVPVVPDPSLARSLFSTVEVDHMIPLEMFAAVAELLAFVYRMAGQRKAAV